MLHFFYYDCVQSTHTKVCDCQNTLVDMKYNLRVSNSSNLETCKRAETQMEAMKQVTGRLEYVLGLQFRSTYTI